MTDKTIRKEPSRSGGDNDKGGVVIPMRPRGSNAAQGGHRPGAQKPGPAPSGRGEGLRAARRPVDARHRSTVVAFVAILLLALALFWVFNAIVKHNAVQNCIDSGRRDCVPLPLDPR